MLLCISCARPSLQAGNDINKFALAKGNPIHYVETGSGPPVMLIPGLFGTYRIWDRMVPYLDQHYRLLAIDNFGTGYSGKPADGFHYSVAEQADMIVAMMDELNISCITLVGVSYGGMIALNIAARYPERVVNVVCIEGGVIMPKQPRYKMVEQGLTYPIIGDTIIGLIRSGLFDETMAEGIIGSSWDDMAADEKAELIDIVSHNANAATRLTWLGLSRALDNSPDFTDEAKSITAPVLYLSGDKSSFRDMTEMNIAYFKNNLPDVRLVSFEDGVHDLELQKPRETAALILEFIAGNTFQSTTAIDTFRGYKHVAACRETWPGPG